MTDLQSPVFTVQEAAEYLKINPQVMERYLRQGAVPGRKVGRLWRLSKAALDLWLASSVAPLLAKTLLWEQVFNLGEELNVKNLSEEEVTQLVIASRRKSGFSLKSGR